MTTVTPRIATVLPQSGKRFHWLLAALLFQIVASPFVVGAASLILQDFLFLAILLAALGAVSHTPLRRFNSLLALICSAAVILKYSFPDWYLDVAVSLLGAIVILSTAVEMVNYLSRQRRVDLDTVLGGLCVYLFMGALWLILYTLAVQFDPLAFDFTVHGRNLSLRHRDSLLLFFSYVTLLTTGYGDVVPISPMARTLAILEGICGQFYLVFFMARLVGLHVAEKGGAAPSSSHSEEG